MKLSNLKIGTRLALSFGVICASLVVIAVLSTTMLGVINDGAKSIAADRMPKIEATNQLLSNINDIAIALRNMMLTDVQADRQKQIEQITALRESSKEKLDTLQKTLGVAKPLEVLQRMQESNEKYVQGQKELIRLLESPTPADAKAFLAGTLRPLLVTYKKDINEQLKLQTELTQELVANSEQTFSKTRTLMIGLSTVILAFAALIAYVITVSITRPITQALKIATTVASGDLTSRIESTSRDETGQLLQALKLMNESLVRIVSEVRTGTDTMATASGQIAAGNLDLSSRTEEQASSLEETASSMEELTSTVKQNADNARQANQLAVSASAVAVKGGDVVAQVVGTMGSINDSAKKIVDIIGVIDGIAFQTNILALNAAVEAARAGEQGRGFAVVATEVRSLAQRSAAAAKEIKSLIGDSVEKVEAGSILVGEAGSTMEEIVSSVARVTGIMAEIMAASQEQSAGIEQVNQAIGQMDQVTQQNAALVEQAAAAAESLQDQASNLSQTVAVFKLDRLQTPMAAQVRKPEGALAASARSTSRETTAGKAKVVARAPAQRQLAAAGNGQDWEEF